MDLLEDLWVSMAHYVEKPPMSLGWGFTEGYAHWEAVTIGGKTRDGRDASNELSYLMLKSKREFPLNYPDLSARIHSQTPDRFLFEVCETIKDGTGIPKLFNDEEIIPYFLSRVFDRSIRIYAAMLSRGFQKRMSSLNDLRLKKFDCGFAFIFNLLILGIVVIL